MNHGKKNSRRKWIILSPCIKHTEGTEWDELLLWKAFLDGVERSVELVIHLPCLVLTQIHSHSLYCLTHVSSHLGLFTSLSTLPKLSCPWAYFLQHCFPTLTHTCWNSSYLSKFSFWAFSDFGLLLLGRCPRNGLSFASKFLASFAVSTFVQLLHLLGIMQWWTYLPHQLWSSPKVQTRSHWASAKWNRGYLICRSRTDAIINHIFDFLVITSLGNLCWWPFWYHAVLIATAEFMTSYWNCLLHISPWTVRF